MKGFTHVGKWNSLVLTALNKKVQHPRSCFFLVSKLPGEIPQFGES